MRILYLLLCLAAVTASPARTFKRTHPRKIEEKTETVKEPEKIEESLEIKEKPDEEKPRAIFEQVNVVSSTMASNLEGIQDIGITPHVISLPQINIGWPQGSTTIAPVAQTKTSQDEKASAKRGESPENEYQVNIYINFNEDSLVYEEDGKKDQQRKKKPKPSKRPTTTTTTTEDYDYWYIDYVSLKDKPNIPECPDGYKKMNGKCAQRRCQKGEALIGGVCAPIS